MSTFVFENAEYVIHKGCAALFKKLISPCYRFVFPSEAISPSGKKYPIIGIQPREPFSIEEKINPSVISFDEASGIEVVTTSFLFSCRKKFHLPPKIKRIKDDGTSLNQDQIKIISSGSKFVSVTGKRNLSNNFPFSLLFYFTKKKRIHIRETVKYIETSAMFSSNEVTSVVIPPSVERIGLCCFSVCEKVRSVEFSGISHLITIGSYSFMCLPIVRIDIPRSVKEIKNNAFESCSRLTTVTFQKESRLEYIGNYAFTETNIDSIDIPKSVSKIDEGAFKDCKNLKTVTFAEDSCPSIASDAFSNCPYAKAKEGRQKLRKLPKIYTKKIAFII